MKNPKLGTLILVSIILLLLMGLAFIAGAAMAQDTDKQEDYGILSQLRQARNPQLVNRTIRMLEQYYFKEIDEAGKEELIYGAIDGIFNKLHQEPYSDLFSHFYNPTLYKELQAQTSGEYAGIGILMGTTDDGMYPEIVTVFPNTPAENAGFMENDIITEVEGESMYGMFLEQVANRIKGEVGSTVQVQVYRPESDEFIDQEIERQKVEFSSVPDEDVELFDNGVGVIRITNFAMETGEDFQNEMDALLERGMKSLVIDVRGNSGGLVDAAYEVANLFIKEGLIVKVEARGKNGRTLEANPDSKKYELPIVVLQNENSASASEILCAALKDHGLAKVVGETSFGKGVVQAVQPLEYFDEEEGEIVKSAVAITIGAYKTPAGHDLQNTGIDPDIWYELANQFQDDPVLADYDRQLQELQEQARQLRIKINDHVRSNDAAEAKAVDVANRMARGEDVPDEPRLVSEEEHNPADSNLIAPPTEKVPVVPEGED